jgi:ribosomal protein S18 acetylase RimI-like enzyme
MGPSSSGAYLSSTSGSSSRDVPYVVERVDGIPRTSGIYDEIADMCIEAFFNDARVRDDSTKHEVPASFSSSTPHGSFRFFRDKMPPFLSAAMSSKPRNPPSSPQSPIDVFLSAATTVAKTPTKSLQLLYLRNLQSGDLKRRRERETDSNMMFVARRLVPIADDLNGSYGAGERGESSLAYLSSPLVLDLSNAYNLRQHPDGAAPATDYVRGEILGFVEVTNRPFGLGMAAARTNGYGFPTGTDSNWNRKRPVLTNLSVRREERQLGVGSRLLELCEQHVVSEWGETEVVLEVENDNDRAIDFYRRRGYQILFMDGAARRYDLSGLWLREVRCQRLIMRKQLAPESSADAAVQSTLNFSIKVLQAIKDNMFSSVA